MGKASARSQFVIFSMNERGFDLSLSMIKGQMSFDLKHSKHAELHPHCTPTAIYTTV